jgi:hypothetical protein
LKSDGIVAMNDVLETRPQINPKFPIRRIGLYAIVILFAFLLGFIPMWLKARERTTRLATAEHQLTFFKIQDSLASAVISSRRGEYEPARQSASQFFTSLGLEIDKGTDSSLTQAQRDSLQPLFAGRDEIITLLARSDPAASDRLSDLYVAFRKIVNT